MNDKRYIFGWQSSHKNMANNNNQILQIAETCGRMTWIVWLNVSNQNLAQMPHYNLTSIYDLKVLELKLYLDALTYAQSEKGGAEGAWIRWRWSA